MKTLFVLSVGLDKPGPSIHLLESMMLELTSRGHSVHVIQKETGKGLPLLSDALRRAGVTYDAVPETVAPKTNFVKRYFDDIKYAFACRKYYKKHIDCDAVFLQSSNVAGLQIRHLKKILNKRVVFNVQDIFPVNAAQSGIIKESSLIYKIFAKNQRFAYKNADSIITISEDMKKTLIQEGVSPDKIEVVYNWSYSDELIDIKPENNKFIKQNNIDTAKFNVVYAGNIGSMQNADIVLNAAVLLKDNDNIHFYIIGDGVAKQRLLQKAEAESLDNVSFFPMQPSEMAPHIYSMADVNIIPLANGIYKTALPSKTATCLACGRPIIACLGADSRFAQKLAECDCCFSVDSDDHRALADCIIKLQSGTQDKKEYSTADLYKEYFLRSTNSKKYADILTDCV